MFIMMELRTSENYTTGQNAEGLMHVHIHACMHTSRTPTEKALGRESIQHECVDLNRETGVFFSVLERAG